jgi:hypothetical protein
MTPRLLLAIIAGFGLGWFLLSWRVIGTDPGSAAAEALGAALGLMVFISVIGALHKNRVKRLKK